MAVARNEKTRHRRHPLANPPDTRARKEAIGSCSIGGRTLEYHQNPITSTNLKNSFEEFERARRQLRNSQDDAREESHELRDQLKEYWKGRKPQPAPLPPIEDEDDYEVIEQQPEEQPTYQPTPSTSSKPRHGKTLSSGSSHSTMSSSPLAVNQSPSSQSSRSHKRLDCWQVGQPHHAGSHQGAMHQPGDARDSGRDGASQLEVYMIRTRGLGAAAMELVDAKFREVPQVKDVVINMYHHFDAVGK
ncbi:hypothetical protein B0T24DRAFT_596237 [Lasiosphaeria ovina]|uniref:Uncharacterized protein n=1 Tax=Lasiosphaeria ovina TaxID=92902 RepID=A0AAE0K545_9PEZI|nr:hypothetical protein B0T24DRAFT_596237 [Lasiosphaeria ovina]